MTTARVLIAKLESTKRTAREIVAHTAPPRIMAWNVSNHLESANPENVIQAIGVRPVVKNVALTATRMGVN